MIVSSFSTERSNVAEPATTSSPVGRSLAGLSLVGVTTGSSLEGELLSEPLPAKTILVAKKIMAKLLIKTKVKNFRLGETSFRKHS